MDTLNRMRNSILNWGNKKMRKFPWRETGDPYRIILAEIFLQRTTVKQVLPVYTKFILKYPDAESFFKGRVTDIKKMILPLGLRWRAEKLIEMRDYILKNLNGDFPSSKEELVKISGIGDYTAGAVRMCAFGIPDTPLDTNTVRITGRFFGLEIKDTSRRDERFRKGLYLLIHPDEPRKSFYALVDIGSTVCIKKRPFCKKCPIKNWCKFNCVVNKPS